jgi:prolyl 4-hydroxylase
MGFKKIKCPEKVFKLLKSFWDKNKDKKKLESWFSGNTYTNSFQKPSYMVSIQDTDLEGGGDSLYNQIALAAQDTIQNWTGLNLRSTSIYGIRIYTEGAILTPHVDRLPLISSAIVNVDQDLDEP